MALKFKKLFCGPFNCQIMSLINNIKNIKYPLFVNQSDDSKKMEQLDIEVTIHENKIEKKLSRI